MKKRIINIIIYIFVLLIMVSNSAYASNKKLLGDINQDNIVDSRDQLLIMRHIMASTRKTHPEWILLGDKYKLADVTQNGIVDNGDMLKILRYIAAKRNPEKIGNKYKNWLEIGEINLDSKQKEIETNPTPETQKTQTIEVSSITLNKTTLSLDMSGTKTATLIATIEPNNATNKSITYSTSNEKVATVDKNGKIAAKGNGTATITATSSNGKKATCKVTVKTSATSVKLTKTSANIAEEKEITLFSIATPYTTTDENIEWTNSNQSIVELEKKVEEGTYYIKSALDENKVVEIINGTSENKAKVQLNDMSKEGLTYQKLEFISVGNGYYIIRAKHSGKVLDVTNGGKEKGTKIQQYSINGTDAQIWKLEYVGNGYYYIRSKLNGLYLDIKDGKAVNGSQLQVWSRNKTNAQRFKLELIEKKSNIITEGTYHIKTALNENKLIEVSNGSSDNKAKVQIYDKNSNDVDKQKFEIIDIEGGYCIIKAKHSGKVLDVTNGGKEKGTKIQQYNFNGTDSQIWKLEKAGNGYYYIKSKLNGLYLDVSNGKAQNGVQLQVWSGNKTLAQKFKFEKVNNIVNKNIDSVTLKAKKVGTATIKAKISNGKTASCKITISQKAIFPSSYIKKMQQKLMYYGSRTNYGCVIDADLCRLTIFKKEGNNWNLIKAWDTVQGVNTEGRIPGYRGPRSHSYKGVFEIFDKLGTNKVCFVNYINHGTALDLCQRIEPSAYGDPANIKLSNRFRSLGCCCLKYENAVWVNKNLPVCTRVIVFDKYNPMPGLKEQDKKEYKASPTSNDVPTSISVSPKVIALKKGQSKKLTVTTNPKKSTHKGFSYKSSNTNIVTVDKNGKVTAKSKGTATITVQTLLQKTTCVVIVE